MAGMIIKGILICWVLVFLTITYIYADKARHLRRENERLKEMLR